MRHAGSGSQDFWARHLGGAPAPTGLPADRPSPPVSSFIRETLAVEWTDFPPLGGGDETTPQELLAALVGLVARLTLQTDLVLGGVLPHAPDGTGQPALFRVDLGDDPSGEEVLERVASVLDEIRAHAALPLPDAIALTSARGGRTSLPVLYLDSQWTPGFDEKAVSQLRGNSDLVWAVDRQSDPSRISVTVEFDAELHDRRSVERMARYWMAVVSGLRADPRIPLAHLELVPRAESEELARLLGSSDDVESPTCLHTAFEERCAEMPDAVALTVPGGARLTYDALNRRANQLAHRLLELGATPDCLIGVFLDRTEDLVVGILGVLKAGAGYLPIDMSQPQDRIEFVLEDAEVRTIVSTSELADRLPGSGAIHVLVDRDRSALEAMPEENPEVEVGPGHLAYVIYTSGSTGNPKGVMVEHRHVSRLLAATHPWFQFGSDDVWTLFHSSAFDFSVWEIWGALLYGGRLVVVPYMTTRSPETFYRLLREEGVTVLNQTPSAFKQLLTVDAQEKASDLKLRWIIFGGEALDPSGLRGWFDRHGDQTPRLINMYGITETTVHVTYRPVTRPDTRSSKSLIGRPVPDLRLYVLDPVGRVVPPGVPGEMFVGGGGVSRGYLRRPELTAERFVPDRFSLDPSSRLYRTGDLAVIRSLDPLDVEYLGRADNQVKIRGFRIELGEIEAALRSHPGVESTVVTLREDSAGSKSLVAYYVSRSETEVTARDLAEQARARLPEYMVPSAFEPLETIPLTANGKVDIRALPAPSADRSQAAAAFTAPKNAIEQKVCSIYQSLLGIEQVGTEDNFFELGGDSILVGTVVQRLRADLEVAVEPLDIFQFPTIRALAQHLGQGSGAPASGAEEVDRRASRRHRALQEQRDRRSGGPRRP